MPYFCRVTVLTMIWVESHSWWTFLSAHLFCKSKGNNKIIDLIVLVLTDTDLDLKTENRSRVSFVPILSWQSKASFDWDGIYV